MITYTEAYNFLLSVISNVPYGVIAIDLEGFVIMINQQALESLGIKLNVKEVIENPISNHLSEIEELDLLINTCIQEGRKEFELAEVQSGSKYLSIQGIPILNGMLLSINDISSIKQVQMELTNALLEGQELERRRLSKEIHDGIGPLMSTIRINLDAVKNELQDIPPKTTRKLNTMEGLIQNVASDIRSISHALMPNALFDFGLVAALKNLYTKANESELINIEFYHKGFDQRLAQNIELNVYRIAQELLNNALKYAKAQNINVSLIQQKEQSLLLSVEDDGQGFDPLQLNEHLQNGIGLRNINTRVDSLGGHFTIETQLGKGVQSNIEIPI